ncbi:MAG: spermidine synthase [Rhizomicrobium sp.]
MIPWVHLDTAPVGGGRGTLKLMQRGAEFSIMADARTLMNSRTSGSEMALANLACTGFRGRPDCGVLIGGYGMGFTLRAALAELAADARIVVAELVPAVMAWARGPMAGLTAGCLDDPRVTVHEGDVGEVIASHREAFDAIILDVDNGPDGFSRDANDRLYNLQGLVAARNALRPKGILAVWSAAPDDKFANRLVSAGFSVETVKTRANNGRGSWHTIWIATKTQRRRT